MAVPIPRSLRWPRRRAYVWLAGLLFAACRGSNDDAERGRRTLSTESVAEADRLVLNGVGATLPFPLYARWFNEYATVAAVRINYRSEGSPQGIAAAVVGSADFGATDIPVPDSTLRAAAHDILHVPMAVGAVAVAYNIP
jgi:phosphate transport system substrate-binding protein